MDLNSKRFAVFRGSKGVISNERRELSGFIPRISSASRGRVSTEKRSLKSIVALINVISPENILRKGFEIVKRKGEITSDPDQFSPGSKIEIILRSQNIKATVNNNKNYNGNDFNLPTSL